MEKDSSPPLPMLLIVAAFEGGLAVVAAVVCWLQGRWALESLHWSLAAAGQGIAAAVPLLSLLLLAIWFPQGPLGRLMRVLDQYVVPLFMGCQIADLALIAVLAGLGEESLFRVAIQQWIALTIGGTAGVWAGLLVAAAVFGAAHWITPAYGLTAGLIGLYMGLLWLATGNLLVPISAHAMYDFLVLAYLVRIRNSEAGSRKTQQ